MQKLDGYWVLLRFDCVLAGQKSEVQLRPDSQTAGPGQSALLLMPRFIWPKSLCSMLLINLVQDCRWTSLVRDISPEDSHRIKTGWLLAQFLLVFDPGSTLLGSQSIRTLFILLLSRTFSFMVRCCLVSAIRSSQHQLLALRYICHYIFLSTMFHLISKALYN